ncbi:hypothetical protein ZWY2020_059955 [Hordeum vulgare]|nr:hypothetical protein ZWY2020_059955 [Hordeum vulgare]
MSCFRARVVGEGREDAAALAVAPAVGGEAGASSGRLRQYIIRTYVNEFNGLQIDPILVVQALFAEEEAFHGPAKIFTFRELAIATKNFRKDCLLGEGGFGRVYKGHMENGQQVIAVKQLDRNGFQGNREFLVEVLMLPLAPSQSYRPPDREPLDWNARMRIAVGAAKGLEYLHDKANPPVIYRDFKPSNILLSEDYYPLVKIPTYQQELWERRLLRPEYAMTGQLTVKSDVYSFGVVFLELVTGSPDVQRPRKFCQMADSLLQGRYPKRGLYQALAVAAMTCPFTPRAKAHRFNNQLCSDAQHAANSLNWDAVDLRRKEPRGGSLKRITVKASAVAVALKE